MNTIKILIALLATLPLFATAAPIYECTDGSGHKIYTQDKGKNCKASNLGRASVYTSAPVYSAPQQPQTAADNAPPPLAADSAALQAAQNELEQAQKNLEDGKKVRYGNERNYARYLDRVQNLENAVKAAEQKVNSAKIGNSSLARPMMH